MTGHYLSDSQKQSFRDALLEKKRTFNAAIQAANNDFIDANERSADAIDIAAQSETRALSVAENERCKQGVLSIDRILSSFEDYGYCTSCTEEIGLGRLQFNPLIVMCVDCQSAKELKQRDR